MASYNQVQKGSSDSETIRKLQQTLNSKGYSLDVDGVFGDKTYNAVADYQKKNNLAVDGIVGNNTWTSLMTPTQSTGTASTASQTTVPKTEPWSYDAFKVSDGTLAAGQAVQDLQANKPGAYEKSQGVLAAEKAAGDHLLTKPGEYQKSEDVLAAETLLREHLNGKPREYQSQWTPQMDAVMDQILNREKFQYDLASDPMYQQYKQQYMLSGQMAMLDTMGQAAAMTGGHGNSYVQNAGQQAYQAYLQQLNDQVPQLYQLALERYNQEGQDLYNRYGLYADRETQDYGRYRDSVSDFYTDLDYLSADARYKGELDYGRYRDTVADWHTDQDRLTDEARYQGELDYGMYRDTVSDHYTDLNRADDQYWKQYSKDFAEYTDARDMAYQTNRDAVADQQYREQMDYQKERDAVADSQWQKEYNLAASKASGGGSSGGTATTGPVINYKSMGFGSYNEMTEALQEIAQTEDNVALYKKLQEYAARGYLDSETANNLYVEYSREDSNSGTESIMSPEDWYRRTGSYNGYTEYVIQRSKW